MKTTKLMKSKNNKVLSGVCGGIGEYFGIDPVVVRVVWVLFSISGGAGLLAYIVFALVMPDFNEKNSASMDAEVSYGHDKNSTKFLAVVLVVIGSGSLAERFIPWFDWKIVIPAGMLLLGLYLLFRDNGKDAENDC